MEGINDKYYITLSTLTPLAVGDCAEKNLAYGVDIVINNGYLYKLNLQKILDSGIDPTKLTACFEKKEQLKSIIGNRLESVADFKVPLSSGIGGNSLSNPVKACVKNHLSGKPIVPGSSLKGAVSSVLFGSFFRADSCGTARPDANLIFGKPDDGTNFMRFIKFSDIEFDAPSLVNTKIFNLRMDSGHWCGGWKNCGGTSKNIKPDEFNTVYEVIPARSSGIGSIMMSELLFDRIRKNGEVWYASEKERIMASVNNNLTFFFRIINDHTKSYLDKELKFFERYNAEGTDKIIDSINSLLDEIRKIDDEGNNSCVFKMSAGSGYHSITGDWRFDDYYSGLLDRKRNNEQAKPKSRKIAIDDQGMSIMGFVKMSIADASDVNLMESKRENERQEELHRYEEWEAQQERCHLERLAKEQAKLELEKKLFDYRIKIEEADSCYFAGDRTRALSLYREAGDILPNGAEHGERIKEITRYFEAEAAQKKREIEAALEKDKAISEGLSNLERKNGNDETKYLINCFKQVNNDVERLLKKSKEQILPEDQDKYLKVTLSRIYKSNAKEQKILSDFGSGEWKKLARYCGENRARIIFEKIKNS